MTHNAYVAALYDLNEEFPYYERMYELSSSSVLKFLPGISWQVVLRNGSRTKSPYEMLREVFRNTYELWSTGANVFCVDIDVLFVKPVNIWGRFRELRMFTVTCPAEWLEFKPYLNSGVRYFPATMDRCLWDIGFEMLEHYDESYWGYDQVIYNKMFYAQGVPLEIIPGLNYGMHESVKSTITVDEAAVLHFYSTKGAKLCVERMEAHYK